MDNVSRGIYRAQLTKVTNAAQEYLSSAESQITMTDGSNLDTIEEECSVYLQRITAIRESLLQANAALRPSIKSEDFQKESEAIADYEDKAVSLISRLQVRLKRLEQTRNRDWSSAAMPSSQENKLGILTGAKLPHLALKTFSGNFKEWIPFWERFRTAVHERPNLSGADKFNYLQNHLTGKAAESIAGFIPSDENYAAAISMLQEEYGDNGKLIDYTMQQLTALQMVSSRKDVSGLRKLYNDVTMHTRSLTSLRVPSSKYSVMLKPLLLRCMPRELVADYFRNSDNLNDTDAASINGSQDVASAIDDDSSSSICDDSQLRIILRFLKKEVESLERSSSTASPAVSQTVSHPKIIKSAAGLMTTDGMTRSCCFCNSNNHSSHKCFSSISLQQRKEILRKAGRCFRCTGKGHNSRECANKFIKCAKCNGRHSTSMCDPSYKAFPSKNRTREETPTSSDSANLCSVSCQHPDILLQTARALVMSSSPSSTAKLPVRLIIDGGSQRTYITESVVSKLGIKLFDAINLRIFPFGSKQKEPAKSFDRVRVHLKSMHSGKIVSLLAVVVPNICVDVLPVPNADSKIFTGMLLADDSKFNVCDGLGMLIGADNFGSIVLDEIKRVSPGLIATNTILGWTLQGPTLSNNKEMIVLCAATLSLLNVCNDKNCDIKKFWDLESIGIIERKADDNEFRSSIKKSELRYEASLLWRDPNCKMDSNHKGAAVRFNKLIEKLSRVPKTLFDYDSVMQEMIQAGIVEKVPRNTHNCDKIFYMPHRPVYRRDKETTKLRIVFDASASTGNALSLNNHLFQGPNLLPDVLAVLLNFRIGRIALVADIEKAFLQILLNEHDRDSHRFLWFKNPIEDVKKLPVMVEYRMTRVTFGVACSPYLLCATLQKLFNDVSNLFPDTAQILKEAFYMDDLVVSVNDFDSAFKLYTQTCQILNEASMNIRKWNSNNPQLREKFSENAPCPDSQKVLGIHWSCEKDELIVQFAKISDLPVTPTKRKVLSMIASSYDPLGVLGPFIVGLKILFQEIWKIKLDWDQHLPPPLQSIWNKLMKQINIVKEVKIPRCFFANINPTNVQLHLFADASPQAYGCVAYLRSLYGDHPTCVRYVCSKSRVAPLKSNTSNDLTLPKLELTAALLACKLASYLRKNLHVNLDDVIFWTDSRIALAWILRDKQRNKPYIEQRVKEIRLLSNVAKWRHCPGVSNPADSVTRVVSRKVAEVPSNWLQGPEWLVQDEINWPSIDYLPDISNVFFGLQVTEDDEQKHFPIFNIEDFSRYRKALRVTAYVMRYIGRIKYGKTYPSFLRGDELLLAEEYWIKATQSMFFAEEVKCLKTRKQILKSSPILTLRPFMDKVGILRVGTRLQEAKFNFDETYPIILPKSSYFTNLLVNDVHERTLHGGVNVTLVRLRERFWIVKSRQLIKTIVKRCIICQKLRGPSGVQTVAPLPKDRLTSSRAFETIGIDFAGPIYAKQSKADKETKKFYFMILTCAVIRAVHLELVSSLNTEDCVLALRRFFARRGTPKKILSDNARTFKRASIELRPLGKIVECSQLHDFISKESIKWEFIVERAAWWGGFWERLVKVVKDVLKISIGKAVLTKDQLETFLCEAEAVINSRPLTYVSDDPEDLSPLTPNSFLVGNYVFSSVNNNEEPVDADIQAAWKTRLQLINKFSKRFKTEYVQSLRSAHHSINKIGFGTNIKVGDVVLLHDNLTARLFWKPAVVVNTYQGRDGRVRACEVRLPNGFITRRAIQHLYPLELKASTRPAGGCEKY